jgi:hypothetical protein
MEPLTSARQQRTNLDERRLCSSSLGAVLNAIDRLTHEQRDELVALAGSLNEKLEQASTQSVNHAFNVGCSASLAPLGIVVLIVLIASRANWASVFIAVVLAVLLALGFATLVAATARSRTRVQTYTLEIAPEIERRIKPYDLSRPEFDTLADATLPSGALLRTYLTLPAAEPSGEEQAL